MEASHFYLIVLLVCGIGDDHKKACQEALLVCLQKESKTDKEGQAAVTKCLAQ